MKLTKYLSLSAYRIPINSTVLHKTAEELLAQSNRKESMLEFLGWEELPYELAQGFEPQKNSRELLRLIKESQKRKVIKSKRLQSGYMDLVSPRKGIKGWLQKKFRDEKENALPLGYDIFIWLRQSPRLALLKALHDSLLVFCSSAEPRKVELNEVTEYQNSFCPIVSRLHLEKAMEVQKALSCPLKSVAPDFLIQSCSGYVVKYDTQKGIAYYFGEPY
ncbi:MAG: hypothetical protein ACFCUX_03080 [Candidatus Methylacidiphilales bacterium]